MFIITLRGQPSGIYSIFTDKDERCIPMFEQHDDALRYLIQLSLDDESPDLEVTGVDPEMIIMACRSQGQRYSIITADDFIIPPLEETKE